MVNLMRILGTALGVSASSSVLTWRLEVLAHAGGRTRTVPASALIAAVSDALMLLVAFAVIAGIASLVRTRHRAT